MCLTQYSIIRDGCPYPTTKSECPLKEGRHWGVPSEKRKDRVTERGRGILGES